MQKPHFPPQRLPDDQQVAIHRPSPLGKTRRVWGAVSPTCTSHCPTFGGLLSAMARHLCIALKAELHRSHGPTEGMEIPLEGAVNGLHHIKGLGRPPRHWPGESGEDKVTSVHKWGEKPCWSWRAGVLPRHCPSSCSPKGGRGARALGPWPLFCLCHQLQLFLETWVCPACLGTFLEDPSTFGGVFQCPRLSARGIQWELWGLWSSLGTLMQAPDTSPACAAMEVWLHWRPLVHQSRQAAHEQQLRVCAARQPSLSSTRGCGQWRSWDPALSKDKDATALTACLFMLDPLNFSGRSQMS